MTNYSSTQTNSGAGSPAIWSPATRFGM